MPYSKPSDAPDWVPAKKKMQWVEVWNSVYKAKKKEGMSDKDAEAAAFKQAGGVVSDGKNSLEDTFSQSFDAMEWAKAFVARTQNNPAIAHDLGTMLGWFANAIMRGYDTAFEVLRELNKIPEVVERVMGIDASSIKGEEGTGFEPRIVAGVDKGPFECGNCHYFNGKDSCGEENMMKKSKRERHSDGTVVVGPPDCCEYIARVGKK